MTSLTNNRSMQFLVTSELPCPYLEGKSERKIITELPFHGAQPIFELLSAAGFRRTHNMAYRPACRNCDLCIPVRVRVQDFSPNRTLRKVAQKNNDLRLNWTQPAANSEHYRLFSRYLFHRHYGSDMNEMRQADFIAMVEETPITTQLLELRQPGGRLVGASLVDISHDGLSAVYSFYEPTETKRSLGSFLILSIIGAAEERNLPYVYLGYFVPGSKKMAYKSTYRPLEALRGNEWAELEL